MASGSKILIVDDEDGIRALIQGILEDEGYQAVQAANSTQAYEAVANSVPDLVILDIWLEGSADDGLQILKTLKERYPDLPVIMISGHGTVETAVSSIKFGAYDFIEKPFKSDRLLLMIRRALEAFALKIENKNLKSIHHDQELVVRKKVMTAPVEQKVVYPLDGIDLTASSLREAREIFERKYIELQVARFQGNISKTAEFIGMERSALHRKIKMLNVNLDVEGNSVEQGKSEDAAKRMQA